jgi:hypothetical protein
MILQTVKNGFFILFLVSSWASASTFIGNGGNAGDVELQITTSQISRTLSEIAGYGPEQDDKICLCEDVMNRHKMCDSLSNLNLIQVQFCGSTLRKNANAILNILNSKHGVEIIWATDRMEVIESSGARDADAVAQPEQQKIYLNRDQFLSLKDYERIYLLTHELGHLTKFENRYVKDESQIGPFTQADGGRQFLNSMAAAVAMKSIVNGQVGHYAESLSRSKNYKTNWITARMGQYLPGDDHSTKLTPYKIEKFVGLSASYRYQMDEKNGFSLGYKTAHGDAKLLSMTKAEIYFKLLQLQYHYRIFPFSDPMSMAGQSHFLFGGGYETGSAEMKISDDLSSLNEDKKLGSPLVTVEYLLPFSSGIWFQGGAAWTMHNYDFSEIGYISQKNQIYFNLGVSYGF